LIVETGLYMLLRFQKPAVRENYETGNQAFSIHLRFLTIHGCLLCVDFLFIARVLQCHWVNSLAMNLFKRKEREAMEQCRLAISAMPSALTPRRAISTPPGSRYDKSLGFQRRSHRVDGYDGFLDRSTKPVCHLFAEFVRYMSVHGCSYSRGTIGEQLEEIAW